MVPPHDKPIFSTFCSSVIPNSSICGFPSLITSMQVSKTAGSTQPPLTEPANSPLSLTANFAPGLRGAEPAMETTVASATFSPRARHRSISGRTSRIKHLLLVPKLGEEKNSTLHQVYSTPQPPCAAQPHCAPGGYHQSSAKDCPG